MITDEIGNIFVDGAMIDIKSVPLDKLENYLKILKNQKKEKIEKIAKIISET